MSQMGSLVKKILRPDSCGPGTHESTARSGNGPQKRANENPLGGSKNLSRCGVNLTFQYSSDQSPRLLTVLIANLSAAVTHW